MWNFILSNFEILSLGTLFIIAMVIGIKYDKEPTIHNWQGKYLLFLSIYAISTFFILPNSIPKFEVSDVYPLIEMNGSIIYEDTILFKTKDGEVKTLDIEGFNYRNSDTGVSRVIATQKFNNDLTFPACISVDRVTSGDNTTTYEIIIVN